MNIAASQASLSMRPFLLRLLVLVPLMLACWWFAVLDHLLALLLPLLDWSAGWLFADRLVSVEKVPYVVEHRTQLWVLKTTLAFPGQPLSPFAPTFDPIRFTIGLPVLWALLLASPRHRLRNLLLGTPLYIAIILSLMLLYIQGKFALLMDPRLVTWGGGETLLALPGAYPIFYLSSVMGKLAELVLPPLMPVLTWLLFYPGLLNTLFAQAPVEAEEDPAWWEGLQWPGIVSAGLLVLFGISLLLTHDREAMQYRLGKQALDAGDYVAARGYFESLADYAGYAPAQYQLGLMYMAGLGVPKDPRRTLFWYRKAASGGEPSAQYYLADMYFRGVLVGRSPQAAYRWFKALAEQGYGPAQHQLGSMLERGVGVDKDPQSAAQWLERAERSGYKAVGSE